MLVAEHESLVTQVEKLAHPQYRSDDNKEDQLSDLLYGDPPRTSSSPLFHGDASPIPIPVPAPSSPVPGTSIGLPSSSESPLDKENSAPGSQQSVVMELVAIVEEDILDINKESSHVIGHLAQCELVHSLLGQRCHSKAHPSCCDHHFHPFPQLRDGGDGFLFGCRGQGEQNIGGGDQEQFRQTRCLREGADGDGDIKTNHSTDGSQSGSPVPSR